MDYKFFDDEAQTVDLEKDNFKNIPEDKMHLYDSNGNFVGEEESFSSCSEHDDTKSLNSEASGIIDSDCDVEN